MSYFKIKIKLIETNDDQYMFCFNIHVKITDKVFKYLFRLYLILLLLYKKY